MLAYIFVLLAVAVRFLILQLQPHPWHFTPVVASLLFFGANRPRRQLWIPFAVFAVTDVVLTLGFYKYPFTWDHLVTWAWYAAILFLGRRLSNNSKPVWVIASALTSSVSFFLVSNFAVWAVYDMYPKNLPGLMTSYAMGLPFFQRAAIGDVLFTSVFFAIPVVVGMLADRRAAGPVGTDI